MKRKRQEQVYNKNIRKEGVRTATALVSLLSDTAGAWLAVFGQVWLDQICMDDKRKWKKKRKGLKQKKSFKGEKEHRSIVAVMLLRTYVPLN